MARVRLLNEARGASNEAPINKVVFNELNDPKIWPGRVIPGNIKARGTWLQVALRNEADLELRSRLINLL